MLRHGDETGGLSVHTRDGEFAAQRATHAANRRGSDQASCAGCGTRWGGLNTAHCAACHQTFTSVAAFDTHRVGPMGTDARGNPRRLPGFANDTPYVCCTV